MQPGEHVLINGAAGGVGTFAVQLAKALGAEVTAVCSTRNVDMVRALGADDVIDYTRDDVVGRGDRFDVMFDNVGDRTAGRADRRAPARSSLRGDHRPQAQPMARPGPTARPGPMGGSAAPTPRSTSSPSRRTATTSPTSASSWRRDGSHPPIDRVVGLDGVAAGIAELGTGHTRAKIVRDAALIVGPAARRAGAIRENRRPDVSNPSIGCDDSMSRRTTTVEEAIEMKYMLLLRTTPGGGPQEGTPELDAEMAQWGAVYRRDAGRRRAPARDGPRRARAPPRRCALTDGERVLTDGPFAETKELLFSFFVIDVADLDAALEWAAKMPNAAYGSVEIRPLSPHEQDAVAIAADRRRRRPGAHLPRRVDHGRGDA